MTGSVMQSYRSAPRTTSRWTLMRHSLKYSGAGRSASIWAAVEFTSGIACLRPRERRTWRGAIHV